MTQTEHNIVELVMDWGINAVSLFMILFVALTFIHIPSFSISFHPPLDKGMLESMIWMALLGSTCLKAFSFIGGQRNVVERRRPNAVWHPGNRI